MSPTKPQRPRVKKPKAGGLGQAKRRYCQFCKEKTEDVDYKNAVALKRFVSEKGKIRSRSITGACRRHQFQLSIAVKRAREMALLPYVSGGQSGDHSPGRRSRSRV
jgi:small subunit ribosomal protein S18